MFRRLIAWWRKPACPGAGILMEGDRHFLEWVGPVPAAPARYTPIVTDWDVAKAFEQIEPEPGRVEYRFLGVTGEEEA